MTFSVFQGKVLSQNLDIWTSPSAPNREKPISLRSDFSHSPSRLTREIGKPGLNLSATNTSAVPKGQSVHCREGVPVAQWVKHWPTDLADRVQSSLKAKSSQM